MKAEVTKEKVVITEYDCINEGELYVNSCEFSLPECFDGLNVTAVFNNIPVPVIDNQCVIPSLANGSVEMGVYAYAEADGELQLMYSPMPAVFFVKKGSYTGEVAVEKTPTITEYEQFCYNFTRQLKNSLSDDMSKKQDTLVSGENIKTVNGKSLLGSGDIAVGGGNIEIPENVETTGNKVTTIDENSTHEQYASAKATYDEIQKQTENKQDKLISGTNLKTINGVSLLGSGDISIEGTETDGVSSDVVELREEIKNSIGEKTVYRDITDTFTLKTGAISTSTGKFNLGVTIGQGTDIFSVTQGEKYRVTGYFTWYYPLIALYSEAEDGTKEFIKSLGYYQNGKANGYVPIEYIIPETEIKTDQNNNPVVDENGNPIELTVTHMACSTYGVEGSPLVIEKEFIELKNVQEGFDIVREEIEQSSAPNKVAIDIMQKGESVKEYTVEYGTLSDNTASDVSSPNRMRTGFIAVYGNNIKLYIPQGLRVYIWEFDEDKNFVKYDGWHRGTVEYEVSNPYVRLTVANEAGDNTITAEQVQETIISEYSPLFTENEENTDTGTNTEIVLTENETLACEKFSSLFISTTGRTESLLFFTDPHLCTSIGVKTVFEATMDRIKAVYNNIPVSTCVCGGDWLSTGNTKENAVLLLGKIDCAMRSRFKNYINVLGNHDTNYMGSEYVSTDRETAKNCILTNEAFANVWYRNHGKNYFAVDGDCTRFYVFDTGLDDWHYVYGLGNEDDWYTQVLGMTVAEYKNEQIAWFANSLLEDDPERCAFLLHVGSSKYVATSFVNNITSIAKAFNDKTSIVFNDITYDFSETTGHLYFALAGHAHVDMQYVSNDIPVILTANVHLNHQVTNPPTYDLVLADYGANKIRLVRVGLENSHEGTDDFDENGIRTFDMA